MSYGLYLSASGVLVNLYRQDVFANNLANASTNGFKVDTPMIRQRPPEVAEGGFFPGDSNALLDRLGGGVFAGEQRIQFTAGEAINAGALDVYLPKRDQFFVVAPGGDTSAKRLTRDGNFTLDAQGRLVTASDGALVLGVDDRAIETAGNGDLTINAQGVLKEGGNPVIQLKIVSVNDLDALVKEGTSRFRAAEGEIDALTTPVDAVNLRPEFLEASGTNPMTMMMKMIEATKAATGNGTLIRYHDQLMEQAVNTLGRVTA